MRSISLTFAQPRKVEEKMSLGQYFIMWSLLITELVELLLTLQIAYLCPFSGATAYMNSCITLTKILILVIKTIPYNIQSVQKERKLFNDIFRG